MMNDNSTLTLSSERESFLYEDCEDECSQHETLQKLIAQMKTTDSKQNRGRLGEEYAARWLQHQYAWNIVGRNFRTRYGEIDLIAIDEHNTLVFIEVKTRTNTQFGTPFEAITDEKIRHIHTTSKLWKQQYQHYLPSNVVYTRYDGIAITLTPMFTIAHIRGLGT